MGNAKQKVEGTKLDRATARILQDIEKQLTALKEKGAMVVLPKLDVRQADEYEKYIESLVEKFPSNGVESKAFKIAAKQGQRQLRAKHEKENEVVMFIAYDALDLQLNASRQIPAKTE